MLQPLFSDTGSRIGYRKYQIDFVLMLTISIFIVIYGKANTSLFRTTNRIIHQTQQCTAKLTNITDEVIYHMVPPFHEKLDRFICQLVNDII